MVTRGDKERDSNRLAWGPRILAPLAFFGAATILVLVVNSAITGETESSSPTNPPPPAPAQTETLAPTTGTNPDGPASQRRFYRIREGDTLLSIAERFDTTVEELQELNPGIDANALAPGRRIRVN